MSLIGQTNSVLYLFGQITTYYDRGLERNEYAGRFQKVVTKEDLFR